MKKNFILGLVIALVLGGIVNVILGYFKYGYINKIKNYLYSVKIASPKSLIDKDVKECKQLILFASDFGNLEVTILGNGKPVSNLEVDLSDKPGPRRCMMKTNKDGVILFKDVPVGRMTIYFNNAGFPKEFGGSPTVYIEILKNQTIKKIVELKKQ